MYKKHQPEIFDFDITIEDTVYKAGTPILFGYSPIGLVNGELQYFQSDLANLRKAQWTVISYQEAVRIDDDCQVWILVAKEGSCWIPIPTDFLEMYPTPKKVEAMAEALQSELSKRYAEEVDIDVTVVNNGAENHLLIIFDSEDEDPVDTRKGVAWDCNQFVAEMLLRATSIFAPNSSIYVKAVVGDNSTCAQIEQETK